MGSVSTVRGRDATEVAELVTAICRVLLNFNGSYAVDRENEGSVCGLRSSIILGEWTVERSSSWLSWLKLC